MESPLGYICIGVGGINLGSSIRSIRTKSKSLTNEFQDLAKVD